MAPTRPIQFKMMLSEEESQMLRDQAEARGLTASDYLRTLIRDGSEESRAPFEDLARTLEKLGAFGGDSEPARRARAAAKTLRGVQKKIKRK